MLFALPPAPARREERREERARASRLVPLKAARVPDTETESYSVCKHPAKLSNDVPLQTQESQKGQRSFVLARCSGFLKFFFLTLLCCLIP